MYTCVCVCVCCVEFTEPSRRDVSAHKKDGGSLAGETVGVFRFSRASGSTNVIYFIRWVVPVTRYCVSQLKWQLWVFSVSVEVSANAQSGSNCHTAVWLYYRVSRWLIYLHKSVTVCTRTPGLHLGSFEDEWQTRLNYEVVSWKRKLTTKG